MKTSVLLAAAFLLLTGALAGAAQQDVDLTATWKGTTVIPGGETDEMTLVLAKSPEGYTGKISDAVGLITEAEIYNAAFKEGKLTFSCTLNDGVEISIELTLTEGKLLGLWSHPEGASGGIELIRQ